MQAQRRRGIVFVLAAILSLYHLLYNDIWWLSPGRAAASVLLSIAIVGAGLWAGRLWGLALLMQQAIVLIWVYAVIDATAIWQEGDIVLQRVWEDEDAPCRIDMNTRIRSCPVMWYPSCVVNMDYSILYHLMLNGVIDTTAFFLGPPPLSYLGPIPSETEAFRLASSAMPVEMTQSTIEALFVPYIEPRRNYVRRIRWRGIHTLGIVPLGDAAHPGLLFSWDNGETIVLYDAQTRAELAVWTQIKHPVTVQKLRSPPNNAIWLRRRWLHAQSTEMERQLLVIEAHAHAIGTLYPFIGPMKPGGRFGWRKDETLVEYDPAIAQQFFAHMHALDPTLMLLPWTGGVLGKDAFPEDKDWRRDFVAQAKALVELGADGIHINIEPMPETTPGYLELLAELRQALGPQKKVSVAAYPPPTPLHPYADVHWSTDFLRQVCGIADDIAIMAYDTALDRPEAYTALVAHWTQEIANTPGGCDWRIGVPDYDDDKPWHRPQAETLSAALDGVIQAEMDGPFPGLKGLAIYSSWTTSPQEWAEFDLRWNNREPTNMNWMDPPD